MGALGHTNLLLVWAATLLAFLVGAFTLREHLLDDTFIHLRYVENLSRDGELAYNPGEPSFGTSALTFVLLLAKVAVWLPREGLPAFAKSLSVLWHAGVLGLLAWRTWSLFRQRATSAALSLSAFALAVALLPSGRWLEDGMETSLAVFLSILAPLASLRIARNEATRGWQTILCGLAAAAPGCLRIDLLPISLAALGLAVWPSWKKTRSLAFLGAWALALLIAMASLYATTGHIASDSALAKQAGHIEPLFTLSFLYSMLTVSPVWLLGAAGLLWALRTAQKRTTAALGLLPIAAVLLAGTAVGQFIHGARYFLPALGFAWIVSSELLTKDVKVRNQQAWVMAALGVSVVHAVVLAKPIWRVTRTAELHLEALSEVDEATVLAAHDIGRLGWYTKARVLDLAGLVNGREFATPGLGDGKKCDAIEALGIPRMLVLTETQSEPFRNGDIIDIRCAGFALRYRKQEEPVMKAWNVATPLAWFVWRRVVEGHDQSVRNPGGLP